MTPGERLRAKRKAADFTVSELGARAGALLLRPRAISASAVRNHENGTTGIPIEVANAYSAILGFETAWLFWGDKYRGEVPFPEMVTESLLFGNFSVDWEEHAAIVSASVQNLTGIPVQIPAYSQVPQSAYMVMDDRASPMFERNDYVMCCRSDYVGIHSGDIVRISKEDDDQTVRVFVQLAIRQGIVWAMPLGSSILKPAPLVDLGDNVRIGGVVVGVVSTRQVASAVLLPVQEFIPWDLFRRNDLSPKGTDAMVARKPVDE